METQRTVILTSCLVLEQIFWGIARRGRFGFLQPPLKKRVDLLVGLLAGAMSFSVAHGNFVVVSKQPVNGD